MRITTELSSAVVAADATAGAKPNEAPTSSAVVP